NYSGKVCSHKVVSAVAESITEAPSPSDGAIKTTGRKDKTIQYNIDMPGNDYRNQPLSGNDPLPFPQLCHTQTKRRAMTFVAAAGVQHPRHVSGLTTKAPSKRIRLSNVVSGEKPGPGTFHEYNTDRPGKEYRRATGGDWWDCDVKCDQEAPCKSWTWMKQGS